MMWAEILKVSLRQFAERLIILQLNALKLFQQPLQHQDFLTKLKQPVQVLLLVGTKV
jgi:hypothetical protein